MRSFKERLKNEYKGFIYTEEKEYCKNKLDSLKTEYVCRLSGIIPKPRTAKSYYPDIETKSLRWLRRCIKRTIKKLDN